MEIPMDGYTPEQYAELDQIAKNNVCSECDGDLQIHTNPEHKTLEVGCLKPGHKGFKQKESITEQVRRGATAPEIIQQHIQKRMLPKAVTVEDLNRQMGLVHAKYPDVLKDPPTAALFLMDCMRLGLDPLLSPAEVVPAVFNKKQKGEKTPDGKEVWAKIVVEIITEDGFLSGAARAEPEEWNGPPRVMPLQDYLMTLDHLKDRSLEVIEKIAKRQAKDLCDDENAYVWVAQGRRKSDSTAVKDLPPAYGWFTQAEKKENASLPSGSLPGNQARVRAVKRWTRETFPAWRQRMLDMTSEWTARSEGVKEATRLIEGEYRLIGSGQRAHTDKESKKQATQGLADIVEESAPAEETEETKKDREMIEDFFKALRRKNWDVRRIYGEIWKVLGTEEVKDWKLIPADKVKAVATRLADLVAIA